MPILLADDFPPAFGGIQQYMRSLADAFHSLGKPVTVIAPAATSAEEYDAALPYRVVRLRARSRSGRVAQTFCAGLQTAKQHPEYTIASLWFPSGLAASMMPLSVRGPLGVLVHGTDVTKPRGLRRAIMRTVLERADAVIANSNFTRTLLEESRVRRNVHISTCGVDDFDCTSNRSSVPIVLAVGRLITRKGFDKLIDAFPSVVSEIPNAICEIVGDGPERESLREQAHRLGLSANIVFRGALDDQLLRDAYCRAWCFALPVRRHGDDVEGFGIVYLEAAMAQLPAIGGLDSGAADAIVHGKTGLLVDGTDVNQIGTALISLLRDRSFAAEMGRNARIRARSEFSWQSSAQRINDLMTRNF